MIITDHAYIRMKERCGWNHKAADKMANIAYNNGITHSQTKGKLNRYLDKQFFSHKSANNMRIYSQKLFVFHNDRLITVQNLPQEFYKYIKKIIIDNNI